jgi:Flp pilus assembly protein TadD
MLPTAHFSAAQGDGRAKGLALQTGGSVSSVLMATPASKPGRHPWLTWAALAICALVVWAVFGGARHFHFVLWDDDYNIQQNPHLGGLTWENLRWMFTDTAYARRYFPLTWLGWNIEYDLFGLTPRSAHLGNVLFHLLNTILVFLVIKAALRIWLARETTADGWPATAAAVLGALFWALHPLRVEVVAWASGRIYAQAACFILLSLWCYLRSVESPPGSACARRFRWASAGALALSLLTYPLALSFVGVLLVLDWYLPGRLQPAAGIPRTRQLWPMLVEMTPFLAVTAIIFGLTLWARTNVQAVGWKPPVTLEQFGVVPRILQACYVWIYYLWKPLLPFHLSPYYTQLISFHPNDGEFVASLAAVGLITAVLFWRRQRWPGLWLLWLCHLVVLFPVLGLTEHPHFTNDRYSYVASVLWSVAIAVVIVRLWPRWVAIIVPCAIIAALAVLSLAQVAVWQNTETLGLHMLAQLGDHPRRFDIYSRMATALREEGKPAESNAYYLKSLGGDPMAAEKAISQAKTLEEQGQPREAFVQYLLASQLRPDLAEPHYRLGAILLADNRAAEALPFLKEAVRLQPDAPVLRNSLGVALTMNGQPQEAIAEFEQVVRLDSRSPVAHFNLGLALLNGVGRNTEAAAQFEIVLQLEPDYPGAQEALARSRR